MEAVFSINSVPIRLTSERWLHIVENHDDLAGKFHEVLETVAEPDCVAQGASGELIATRTRIGGLSLAVVYKELSGSDGFIITAFQTSKLEQLFNTRPIIWRTPSSKKP